MKMITWRIDIDNRLPHPLPPCNRPPYDIYNPSWVSANSDPLLPSLALAFPSIRELESLRCAPCQFLRLHRRHPRPRPSSKFQLPSDHQRQRRFRRQSPPPSRQRQPRRNCKMLKPMPLIRFEVSSDRRPKQWSARAHSSNTSWRQTRTVPSHRTASNILIFLFCC